MSANLFYNRSNRRNQTYNVTGSKWTKSDHLRFDTIGLDLQKQITGKFGDVIVGTTVSRDSYKNDITVAKTLNPVRRLTNSEQIMLCLHSCPKILAQAILLP